MAGVCGQRKRNGVENNKMISAKGRSRPEADLGQRLTSLWLEPLAEVFGWSLWLKLKKLC